MQQSFYLEQLSSGRHVQHSAGGEVKRSLEEGAQSRQYRRLPHGFADLVQFCPLLTASWLAIQLPVWVDKGGDSRLPVRMRVCRLIGGCCHVKQKQEVSCCVGEIRTSEECLNSTTAQ